MKFVEFNNYVSKLSEACQLIGEIESIDINFRENKEYVSTFYINTKNILYKVNFEILIEEECLFNTKNIEERIYIEEFSSSFENCQYFDTKEQLLSHIIDMTVINTLCK